MSSPDALIPQIEQRIGSEDFTLPVFNQVALQLQGAFEAGASMETAEDMILKDPALAGEVLRVANTAYYLSVSKVENIRQALVRLGTDQVMCIAMIASQKAIFQTRYGFLKQVMNKLWQQATASAEGCRWVAQRYGFSDRKEAAFLCGLLHDSGSLVILKVLEEFAESQPDLSLSETTITEMIDSLHSQYGYQMMCNWELPELYCTVARDHHCSPDESDDVLLHTVRLVDAACAKVGIGLSANADLELEAAPELQTLGIDAADLPELETRLADFSAQFG